MTNESFIRLVDLELDEPLTLEAVAEAVGARPRLLARLIRLGVLDTISDQPDGPLLPTRAVIRLRRMSRLRRDLGVNFSGAVVILDLVERIEQLNREVSELRQSVGE